MPPPPSSSRNKFVVIALPGKEFSARFMQCWTTALMMLWAAKRFTIMVTYGNSSFVTFARMQTLGLDVRRGKHQKPLPDVPYDVYVTLDSDMVFTPEQLIELIDSTDDHAVVSGLYLDAGGENYMCSVAHRQYEVTFLNRDDLARIQRQGAGKPAASRYLRVDYVGMGFFAMRREALEAMQYPYFYRDIVERRVAGPDGATLTLRDQSGEDVCFCLNAKDAGYPVHVKTTLVVGHEKPVVIV